MHLEMDVLDQASQDIFCVAKKFSYEMSGDEKNLAVHTNYFKSEKRVMICGERIKEEEEEAHAGAGTMAFIGKP